MPFENIKKLNKKLTSSKMLLLSFFIIILVGTFFLLLPFSRGSEGKVSFLTAFYTSTSAVCVTGLSVVNISKHFSVFGQLIIMILFQLGGLGIMTFSSLLIILIGRKITFEESKILKEDLNQEKIGGILGFIQKIFIIVITIESLGALLLFFTFKNDFGTLKAIYFSVFHSISAFCNAGFSLFDLSFETYKSNLMLNFSISFLIIVGGIGFGVITGILTFLKDKKAKFSLTSRLAIKVSFWLTLVGAIIFFFAEINNPETIKDLSLKGKILTSLFQSVTTRTAGFNSVSIASLSPASIFLFIFLMFVGASPGSTGGGIKTTTFGVIFLSVISIITNKKDIEAANRRISWDILNRALAILTISLFYIFIVTLIILIYEEKNFVEILFEVVSGFGTVGLSMGITSKLSNFSNVLIIITMFIGRVGPLTFALALGERKRIARYRYPKENITVG